MSKRVIGFAAALVVLVAGAAVWLGWLRPPRESAVVAVADAFVPPASWVLVDSASRDRGLACFDAPCPSASRRWGASDPPGRDELQNLMAQAKWLNPAVEGDCKPIPNRTGSAGLCEATATSAGFTVTVSVSGPHSPPTHPYMIVLSVA